MQNNTFTTQRPPLTPQRPAPTPRPAPGAFAQRPPVPQPRPQQPAPSPPSPPSPPPAAPTPPSPPSPPVQPDVPLSPQKEFERLITTLRVRVSELSDQTFTKKEAWFVLNNELLKFVARCDDDKLREEAFKIVKYLADNIPAAEDLQDTDLDRPFADELNLDKYVSPRQDGKIIKAEDLDK